MAHCPAHVMKQGKRLPYASVQGVLLMFSLNGSIFRKYLWAKSTYNKHLGVESNGYLLRFQAAKKKIDSTGHPDTSTTSSSSQDSQ